MIRECFRAQTGIQFRRSVLESLGIDVGTPDTQETAPMPPAITTGHPASRATNCNRSTTQAPMVATKEKEERADALSRMHDQLEMVKAWWLLEFLPLRHRRQYRGYSRPRHYWSYVSCRPCLAFSRSP